MSVEAAVTLRRFEPGDAAAVHSWFNDPTTTATLLEQRRSFSEEDASAWVQRAIEETGPDRKFALDVAGMDVAAGFTALYGLGGQLAPEVGVLVSPLARGKGIARDALRLTLEQAFGAHSSPRVYARILATNEASKRLFSGLGFRQEGTMRAHVTRDLEVIDVELWGLLRNEFATSEP
jgi:RimJ/RimL family protein N-acetyltransferase